VKKLALIALVGIGLTAFIGADVIKSSVGNIRADVQEALRSEVPLKNQLAEARAQVDVYAESIIRGEVAAENLRDMIGGVEREVRALTVRTSRERTALAFLRDGMQVGNGEAVPAALTADTSSRDQRAALRRVRSFQAASELLSRRESDMERLRSEYEATMGSLQKARDQQVRLADDVRMLDGELESLKARKAAAPTRTTLGDHTIAGSGVAQPHERIKKIRSAVSEQNKLLQYYEYERVVHMDTAAVMAIETPADAVTAIDEALAAYPAK
jgi:predicted nuclease with TOPRIM domain